MLKYLKACPFCGHAPEVVKDPLWHGDRGYIDCYDIYVACRNEECRVRPHTQKFNNIYKKTLEELAELEVLVIDIWNNRHPQVRYYDQNKIKEKEMPTKDIPVYIYSGNPIGYLINKNNKVIAVQLTDEAKRDPKIMELFESKQFKIYEL